MTAIICGADGYPRDAFSRRLIPDLAPQQLVVVAANNIVNDGSWQKIFPPCFEVTPSAMPSVDVPYDQDEWVRRLKIFM